MGAKHSNCFLLLNENYEKQNASHPSETKAEKMKSRHM